ncbi:MAG: RsmE family RNA methyltransferase [Candidatus Zixiibacteriota bacterium]
MTDKDLKNNDRYILTDHRARHIIDILKPNLGDTVEIGFVNGPIGTAIVEKITDSDVILYPEILKRPPEIKPDITLICALPRPQTVKKVLLAASTMGVRAIHFIRANRVEKSFYHSPLLEKANYLPFLIDGLSQGKLTRLPEVTIHHKFKPFFEDFFPTEMEANAIKLLPEPNTNVYLSSITITYNCPIVVAVGPEGGWVPFEIESMMKLGFTPFKLSRSILRVEQAVIAVLSQIELLYK